MTWEIFTTEWNNATIAQRLAALMGFRGMSSHDLAKLSGISHAQICNIRKTDNPSAQTIIKLANGLSVKPSMLLGETTTHESVRNRFVRFVASLPPDERIPFLDLDLERVAPEGER